MLFLNSLNFVPSLFKSFLFVSKFLDQFLGGSHVLIIMWVPCGSQVNLTSRLSIVFNCEPIINTMVNCECAKFWNTASNLFILKFIIIEYLEVKIISQILNINNEFGLTTTVCSPVRFLWTIFVSWASPFVITDLDTNVWVHVAESFNVTGKYGFQNFDFECSNWFCHLQKIFLIIIF